MKQRFFVHPFRKHDVKTSIQLCRAAFKDFRLNISYNYFIGYDFYLSHTQRTLPLSRIGMKRMNRIFGFLKPHVETFHTWRRDV